MAIFKPFKGYRPKKGLEDKLPSFPYDVINSEEAREIAAGNDYSFLHVEKPEIDLPKNTDLYSDEVYKTGAKNLQKFIKESYLIQDQKPNFYIYSQQMGEHFQTGIVGLVSAIEYDAGKIKKHEHTRTEKVIDRTKHIKVLKAHAGPIFLTYNAKNSLKKLVKDVQKKAPIFDVKFSDGIGHKLWTVEDQKLIETIGEEFKKVTAFYIADGHHRCESAAENYRQNKTPETEFFLAVAFPDDELKIMDYNRVVKDLNKLSSADFLKKLAEKFTIQSDVKKWDGKPDKRHCFGLYLDGKWHKLAVKKEFVNENDPMRCLDSYIVTDTILNPILDIKDLKTDKRIDFVGGIRGMKELERVVNKGDYKAAISLFPTSIKELMAIADAGEVMPPKSTWFEPKLRSGFVVNIFGK